MSEHISISTATQGTNTAATKAHTSGKGTGFLGMLMAAIGHKPSAHASTQASDSVHGKPSQTKKSLQNNADAISFMGTVEKSHAKASSATNKKGELLASAEIKAATHHKQSADTLPGLAGSDHAQTTKAQANRNKQDKADSLIEADTMATAEDGSHQDAKSSKTQTTQARNGSGTMSKHHDAKSQSKQATGQATDVSGMVVGNSTAAVMQGVAAAPIHPNTLNDAQALASTTDEHAIAKNNAPIPAKTLVGGSTPTPVTTAKTKIKSSNLEKPSHNMLSDEAVALKQMDGAPAIAKAGNQESPVSTKGTTVQGSATAAQYTANTAAIGLQAESVQNENGLQDSGKASSRINTSAMTSAKQHAKTGHTSIGTHAIQSSTHPQDAIDENAHMGSTVFSNSTASNPSLSQASMHSYSQIASGQTHRQPMPENVTVHTLRSAASHGEMVVGSSSNGGQNSADSGNITMPANPGIGQNIQLATNPQAAIPQAPVHSSGPWTAMAAMQEIGQAAMNGQTRLELKLEPAHLGKIHVRIDSDSRKNIQVHLVVEQASSQQAIEQQLPNLRHALEQQGLNLGNFSMSSQQQGGGQGSGQPSQQAPMSNLPNLSTTQTSMPQVSHAPNEPLGAGRLSIRI